MLGPIFTREWLILPRNGRLQAQRSAWIGLFWVIALTTWLGTAEWSRPGQYLDLSRLGPLIFQVFSVVQVVLRVEEADKHDGVVEQKGEFLRPTPAELDVFIERLRALT